MSTELLCIWTQPYSDCLKVSLDGDVILCTACKELLQCVARRDIEQHVNRITHQHNLRYLQRQQYEHVDDATFRQELTEAFVAANIPQRKLDHPVLSKFLEKYCYRPIPNESSLRKTYLPRVYKQISSDIQHQIADQYLWISMDETTDISGRLIVNVTLGTINPDMLTASHVIATKIIDKATGEALCAVVETS